MIIFLNRLPIPNLRHYCLLSFALFLIVILYANKMLHDVRFNSRSAAAPSLQQQPQPQPPPSDESPPPAAAALVEQQPNRSNGSNGTWTSPVDMAYLETHGYLCTVYKIITSEPWCIWVLINFCYCGLLLFSKVIQGIVFGKLRAVENQHIKDQFWNFIFLKFIFIFGVLNLENMNDLIMWCTWFSIVGWLSIHCQICKDRFEYLSFSTSTPLRSHVKVFVLLVCIQVLCVGLIVASFITQRKIGFSFGLFMFAEAFALSLRTLYVISKYSVHLWDLHQTELWDSKGTLTYYIDFAFEMCVVNIDFMHYFHMLIYGNFYLSMASLVICMELKRLFVDLRRRMRRHSNYLRVIEKMEKRFPWASSAELVQADKCAVCWEKLEKARRLPCGHVFHHNCLRSWLEQDTSCPTCRKSLQDTTADKDAQQQPNNNNNANNQVDQQQQQAQQPQQPQPQQQPLQRNYFHFEGSRYFSWLPSFSVQVTHNLGGQQQQPGQQEAAAPSGFATFLRRANMVLGGGPIGGRRHRHVLDPARLTLLTDQVRQVFPNIPVDIVQYDLNLTHSADITIDNILEERINLYPPPPPLPATATAGAQSGAEVAVAHHLQHQHLQHRNHHLLNNNHNDDVDEVDEDVDDEEDDVDDDDDVSSSDDESNARRTNNGNTTSGATSVSSLFSNILGGGGHAVDPPAQLEASVQQAMPSVAQPPPSLLERYQTSPSNSENTNTLIQMKRDLILNSKKRFLERMQQQQPLLQSASAPLPTTTEISSSRSTGGYNEEIVTMLMENGVPGVYPAEVAETILRNRRRASNSSSQQQQ